jgi:hypothetical protein
MQKNQIVLGCGKKKQLKPVIEKKKCFTLSNHPRKNSVKQDIKNNK